MFGFSQKNRNTNIEEIINNTKKEVVMIKGRRRLTSIILILLTLLLTTPTLFADGPGRKTLEVIEAEVGQLGI